MIIWLEDRESTIRLLRNRLTGMGNIKLEILSSPGAYKVFLEEQYPNGLDEKRKPLLLIDIMLHGVRDLSSIGIKNAPTLNGKHAGYVFADRFLCAKNSPWKGCRICFVTERDIDQDLISDIEQLQSKTDAPVEILAKYDDNDFKKFQRIVDTWSKNVS